MRDKLGRKVSKDEIYSLEANIDAAGPGVTPMPLQSTPREAAVPFADAKPPMKTRTILLIVGLVALFGGWFVISPIIGNMPEQRYNRLNPFTPKPPAGTFDAGFGSYKLSDPPDYYSGRNSWDNGRHFEASYSNDTFFIRQKLWEFKTEAELQQKFDERRKSITTGTSKVTGDEASRYAIVPTATGETSVIFKDGLNLRQLNGSAQKGGYEFEGLIKNAPLAEVVEVKIEKPATTSSITVTVAQLLAEYKADPGIADSKYKGKKITVTGKVEFADKDKKGDPSVGFMKPGSTAPKDGMVVCSFPKSQASNVLRMKKGDAVKLYGRVTGSILGSVIIENCAERGL